MFNVIRQLGGSFGVAFMGTMLTRRTIYHTTTYGQMIDPQSTALHQILSGLTWFSRANVGGAVDTAVMRARALLASHIAKQAFVQAVCDDFLIAAIISIAGVLPILILKSRKRKKKGPMPMAD